MSGQANTADKCSGKHRSLPTLANAQPPLRGYPSPQQHHHGGCFKSEALLPGNTVMFCPLPKKRKAYPDCSWFWQCPTVPVRRNQWGNSTRAVTQVEYHSSKEALLVSNTSVWSLRTATALRCDAIGQKERNWARAVVSRKHKRAAAEQPGRLQGRWKTPLPELTRKSAWGNTFRCDNFLGVGLPHQIKNKIKLQNKIKLVYLGNSFIHFTKFTCF